MSTTATVSISSSLSRRLVRPSELRFACILVTVLTALVLMVHGYHPYAEDGGLYMAGIQRLLDPALYPHGTAFVTEHLRFSLFAPMVAALVRWSHLSLPVVLLLLYLATVWLTLFAAYLLASECNDSVRARAGAVALLAMWITLPIAGTSLMLMDPYVTARSISTPCVLFALAGVLDAFPLKKAAGWATAGIDLVRGCIGLCDGDASADGCLWVWLCSGAGLHVVSAAPDARLGDGNAVRDRCCRGRGDTGDGSF